MGVFNESLQQDLGKAPTAGNITIVNANVQVCVNDNILSHTTLLKKRNLKQGRIRVIATA